MNVWRVCAASFVAAVACGCGSDFRPTRLETTGAPAAPLDQVLDVEVSLTHLQVPGALARGADLELRIDVDGHGPGEHPARVAFGPARVDRGHAIVEDLSTEPPRVVVSGDRWTTSRIGPLRIEGAIFELVLDGALTDDGWSVAGRSWESQSGLEDTFRGWRRHRFLVSGSSFLSSLGRIYVVSLVKERELVVEEAAQVASDAIVRVTGGTAFAVNRLGFDNLQRLDPSAGFETAWQAPTGALSNPHDVLVSGDRGFVTRYEPPYDDVLILELTRGTAVGTIPLGHLATNRHGTPRPDRMREAEDVVFVGLQDIDRTFSRYGEGRLAVFDPDTGEVVDDIPLGGKNPGAIDVLVEPDGATRLYVALSGIFPGTVAQELSGGVVVVSAFTRLVERMALDDDDAGGNIGALAMVAADLGYVVVSDATFRNRVLAFDPRTATVRRTLLDTASFIPDLEVDSRRVLAIPDRATFAERLCLHRVPVDPGLAETSIGCAPLELPPVSVEPLD
jgi:hypothetical protein